ncbi:unnamed protein product [Cuscuta epithymum]|uniref:Uncharacterized GPI-anchored protein At5g19230-like domain-containing protein n=1 Tax=Cuscuta epithymum TaxID=186058 RepID=A0AAV0FMI1_9ASTE|nr:unnamed protein product [Cuscuta epithymum]
MATSLRQVLFICLLLQPIIFIKVRSDDDEEEKNLFQGINSYRATLNLTHLTESETAKCLAEEMANEFKDQPCTNTTGPNTIPGTEPDFQNYPDRLTKCKLNVSTTRDGAILPACVHNLDASLVLLNYTLSSYSANLNDTRFTGMGIGSEKDWIVVVLTTETPEGNFAADESDDTSSATLVLKKVGLMISHTLAIMTLLVLFTSS